MKIRATRTFLNDIGTVRRGAEVEIRDVQAKSLIARGVAVAVDAVAVDDDADPAEPKPKADPKSKGAKPVKGAAAPSEGD